MSFLSTLKGKVDPSRIGVLGICASGGYTSYAAQSDSRIKALATVCVGRMTRNGGLHKENDKESAAAIAGALQAAGQWRTSVANGSHTEPPPMFSSDVSQIQKMPTRSSKRLPRTMELSVEATHVRIRRSRPLATTSWSATTPSTSSI